MDIELRITTKPQAAKYCPLPANPSPGTSPQCTRPCEMVIPVTTFGCESSARLSRCDPNESGEEC